MFNQEKIVELLQKVKNGDDKSLEVLLNDFKPMVSSIARGYFLVGGDEEDLVQEGMIGLYKAIEGYKEDSKTTFSTFAYLCIKRQVQNTIRSSLRKERAKLSDYLPITNQGMIAATEDEENGIYLLSDELNPEESFIEAEEKKELSDIIKKELSEFEFNVLFLYLKGFNHSDIAQKLSKDAKSISNAIARIKQKLQNVLGGENVSSTIS